MKSCTKFLALVCLTAWMLPHSALSKSEDELLAIVNNAQASENERVTACQDLGLHGSAKAIDSLVKLLNAEQVALRQAARYGLEILPDPAVDLALLKVAPQLSGATLTGLLQTFGGRQTAGAINLLIAHLGNQDAKIAAAAAQALSKMPTTIAMNALEKHLNTLPAAAAAYVAGAYKVAEGQPAQAAKYFQTLGQAPQVSMALKAAALRGEILASDKNGLKLWQTALNDHQNHHNVGMALRLVLDAPHSGNYTKTFADALKNAGVVQKQLATALGLRGDVKAVAGLATLAKNNLSSAPDVALAAALALGNLQSPAAIEPLIALSENEDPQLKQTARNALIGLTGPEVDKAIIAQMKNKDASIRLNGAQLALERRMAVALPTFDKLIADDNQDIQRIATRAIGQLGSTPSIPALLAGIRKTPENADLVRALSQLTIRHAQPRQGKITIKSAHYGSFEKNMLRDVTANVENLIKAGSINIQSSGRLCRRDGFSEDPAPGVVKTLRLVYNFDNEERHAAVRENDSYDMGGLELPANIINPITQAYKQSSGAYKRALFQVLVALPNLQALATARQAAGDATDKELQNLAIRTLIDWKNDETLSDNAALAQNAPDDRLKILAIRSFSRQLEDNFVLSHADKLALVEKVRPLAQRDQERDLLDATIVNLQKMVGEVGFKPMFDGKSLTGWSGGGGWWEVKDGILQAQSTNEKKCEQNSHLVWDVAQPANFDLRAEFKLSPTANSGIQIRSLNDPNKDTGYQADMNGGGDYVGFLYHPQQHLIGERGAKVTIAADGAKKVERFADAAELGVQVFKKDDWNEYRILAQGPTVTLWVNGIKTCEFTDHRQEMMPTKGFITLQMHAGPPMKIQYRNLRIKEL